MHHWMVATVEWNAEMAAQCVSTFVAARELRGEAERVAMHMHLPEQGSYFYMHKQSSRSSPQPLTWLTNWLK